MAIIKFQKAIQVAISEWQKALTKLKKCEQALNLKSDLAEAFEEVAQLNGRKESNRLCSTDSFVGIKSSILRMNICTGKLARRKSANPWKTFQIENNSKYKK